MSLIRFRWGQLFPIACLVTVAAFAGCASTTMIQSQPPGARVILNGVAVGNTPYAMTDANIIGSTVSVRLEYPGYEPLNTYISRNEELDPLPFIGGFFLLVPFLWMFKYQPAHFYQLQPAGAAPPAAAWGAPPPGYPQQPPPAGYPPPPAGYPPAQ